MQLNKSKLKTKLLMILANFLILSAAGSCKSLQETPPSKDLCYGAKIEYFQSNRTYSIEEQDRIIANLKFICDNCYNKITFDEQQTCNLL